MAQAATALAPVQSKPSLVAKFASKYSIETDKLLTTLKATAFKQRNDAPITNEQMAALLVVADQYGLNPFTKEIFAFPDKQNGIVPVVGVDGWSRIINGNPMLDGIEFRYSPETVEHKKKTCHEWIECLIHRKDRSQPTVVREYFAEVVRELSWVTPWDSHPNRMHRHKTLIQCARVAFGFAGIYDEDEAHRIIDMGVAPETVARTATMPRELAQVAPTPPAANTDVTDAVPAESANTAPPEGAVAMVNKTQLRILKKKLTNPEIEGWFCKDFGIATVEELPAAKINEALAWAPKGTE